MTVALRLLVVVAVAGLAAVRLGAQGDEGFRLAPRPVRDAVRATAEGQLAAFRAGDFGRAYGFAARGLRRQFREEVFAEMIRRGYPALLGHRRADLGVVRDNREGRARVEVTLTDRDGRTGRLLYQLVEEDAGWRVEGVVTLPPARPGDI
jgi:hypothetical protein